MDNNMSLAGPPPSSAAPLAKARWVYQLHLSVHRRQKSIYELFNGAEAWAKRERELIEAVRNSREDDNEPYGA